MHIANVKPNSDQESVNFAKLQSDKFQTGNKPEYDAEKPSVRKASGNDLVFLNNIKPEQAREFLNSRIGQAITEFSYGKTQSSQTIQATFTRNFNDAESTISNIINNITQAFNLISKKQNSILNETQTNNLTSNPTSTKPLLQNNSTISEKTTNTGQNTRTTKNQNVSSPAPSNTSSPAGEVSATSIQPTQINQAQSSQLEDLINKIQDGFNQAKDALEKLNVLSQGFAPEFNEIQQRVTSFLKFLEDPKNNNLPTPNTSTTDTSGNSIVDTTNNRTSNSSVLAINQQSYQSKSQASIQIETRDGDIVTIDLSNSFSQQQTNAAAQFNTQSSTQDSSQSNFQSNNFSGYVYEASTQTSNTLTFTVSGNLNDKELTAISNLVGDISKTIGQFEKGKVTAALNIAKNIDTQSDQLSGFSFSAQTSEQYRAIDLYQKTQTSTNRQPIETAANNPANTNNVTNNKTNTSAQTNAEVIFANNISNIIYAAENTDILQPAATVNTIFEKFYEQLSAFNEKSESLAESKNENEALETLGL